MRVPGIGKISQAVIDAGSENVVNTKQVNFIVGVQKPLMLHVVEETVLYNH